jgi:hypothetical protein
MQIFASAFFCYFVSTLTIKCARIEKASITLSGFIFTDINPLPCRHAREEDNV